MSTMHIPNARLINFERKDKDTVIKRYDNERGSFALFRVMEERYCNNPLPHMIKVNNPMLLQQMEKMDLQIGDYLTIDGEYDVKISPEEERSYTQIIAFKISLSHETWRKKAAMKKAEKDTESTPQSEEPKEIDLSTCDIFLSAINEGGD